MTVFQDKRAQTLWMGDLEPEMDETFIATAFLLAHEPVVAVRIIKNRLTGDPAGYCFVEFPDEESAQRALLRLNGKPIPGNLHPARRFKLNPSVKPEPGEEYSIFVGDLTEDVDDYDLYKTFKDRYPSTKGAKVVLESNGESRGFGFVRFGMQHEQLGALRDMQFHTGLGGRSIRVSGAMPKRAWPGTGAACVSNLTMPPSAQNNLQPCPPSSPLDSPFNSPFDSGHNSPSEPNAAVAPKEWMQQWMQQWMQWQQYYVNQAQWAQWNQNQEDAAAKVKQEEKEFVGFDVDKSNEEKLRINREFDDEMHDSQWFLG